MLIGEIRTLGPLQSCTADILFLAGRDWRALDPWLRIETRAARVVTR